MKGADGERRQAQRQLDDQLSRKGDTIASRGCLVPLAMLADLVGQLRTARTPQPWTKPTPRVRGMPMGSRRFWSRRQNHQQQTAKQHHQQHSELSVEDEE